MNCAWVKYMDNEQPEPIISWRKLCNLNFSGMMKSPLRQKMKSDPLLIAARNAVRVWCYLLSESGLYDRHLNHSITFQTWPISNKLTRIPPTLSFFFSSSVTLRVPHPPLLSREPREVSKRPDILNKKTWKQIWIRKLKRKKNKYIWKINLNWKKFEYKK